MEERPDVMSCDLVLKSLACGLHHNGHGGRLASAGGFNGYGKALGSDAGRHFVEHHAVAFFVSLEPTRRHGSAAICWKQPDLVDLVSLQRSQVVGHQKKRSLLFGI